MSSKRYTKAEKNAYYARKRASAAKKKKPYVKKKYSQSKAYKKKSTGGYGKYLAPIGSAMGSYFGPVGAAVGGLAGSVSGRVLDAITGHGSYKINANTVYQNSVPQFISRMGDGCIRIRHKEFITDVVSSATAGAFNNNTFSISASDALTFPYLSQLAINFEEFSFEGLVFTYVPSSGSLSTTGQLGTVIMATQYNSQSSPFTNKQQAEASTYAVSQVASQGCIHPIECDARQTPSQGIFYTTRPNLFVPVDTRWSQLGNLNVMTQGMPNASENIGELWATYDVILCKPILIQGSGLLTDHWTSTSGVVAGSVYFGTNPVISSGSDNFTRLGGTAIEFSPSFNGNVMIIYSLIGSAGLWVDPQFSAGIGSVALPLLDNDSSAQYTKDYLASETTINAMSFWTITSTGVPSTVNLTSGTFFSPVFMDLMIVQLPAEIN